jgi:hypothetical protein
VRAHLENLIRFKAEPLVAVIRANGLSRGEARADLYFSERLADVQRAREELRQRVASLQTALSAYQQRGIVGASAGGGDDRSSVGVTPQVSESFIDRIVQLSTQATDVDYRKDISNRIIEDGMRLANLSRQADYYESMRRAFTGIRPTANAQLEADVERRTMLLYDDVSASIERIAGLFNVISQQNLNPDAVLYIVNSPFVVRTTSPLPAASIAQYLLLTLFSVLLLVPVLFLAYDGFRSWALAAQKRDQTRASSGPAVRE